MVVASALVFASPATESTATPLLTPYQGLGTWIDIYSPTFRADPERVAAILSAHGVRTLYLETGNYRQRGDIVRRPRVSALVEAAHARHIAVVAWYLPALANPAVDLRRALAAVKFVSAAGERFDSFALDI